MISVYILKTENLSENSFYDLTTSLPFGESEKARLTAIENSKHKWESLGGLVALDKLLKKIGAPCAYILRSSEGKPYFEGVKPLPFGISHSHGVAAAAIGSMLSDRIGFDIEIVNDNYDCEGIAKRFFSDDELKKYIESGNTADSFFSIWTAKEAYAKKDGQGLAAVLSQKNSHITRKPYCSTLKVDIDGRQLIMSVCSDIPDQPIQIFIDSEER